MEIKRNILHHGIKDVHVLGKPEVCMLVFIHQKGSFMTDMPSGTDYTLWKNSVVAIDIKHEVTNLLSYDKTTCEISQDYNFRKCLQDKIYRVNNLESLFEQFFLLQQ